MKLNLVDNIQSTVDEFKIENFIDLSEAEDYIGKIPGIKDIILGISEALEGLKEFAEKIMAILEAVLKFFDFSNLFDAIGMKDLKNFIFNLVGDTFGGGTLGQKEEIKKYFMDGCASFNGDLKNNYGFNLPNLKVFSLLAILQAMLCNGVTAAYDIMYKMFMKSSDTVTDVEYEDLEDKTGKMSYSGVNELFAKSIAPMVLKTNKSNSIAVLKSVTSTAPAMMARRSSNNIGNDSLNYIEGDINRTKDPEHVHEVVINSLRVLDPGYDMIDGVFNLSTVKDKSKYRYLSSSKTKSREVEPDLTNAVAESQSMSIALLSLF